MSGADGLINDPALTGISGLFGSRAIVVLFGDSLTQRGFEPNGWAGALSNYYSRRADVFNRGYGGYNTRHGLSVMRALFPDQHTEESMSRQGKYMLATLWFGANDAGTEDFRAHVPLTEFEQNIEEMVTHLQKFFHFVVVLSPPPVHEPTRLAYQKRKYGENAFSTVQQTAERALAYGAAVKRAAEKHNALFVDVYSLMMEQGEKTWPTFLGAGAPDGDGLHLSSAGQVFVARRVVETIESHTVPIGELPMELPWGTRLDGTTFVTEMNRHQGHHQAKQIGLGLNYFSQGAATVNGSAAVGGVTLIIAFGTIALLLLLALTRYIFLKRKRSVSVTTIPMKGRGKYSP